MLRSPRSAGKQLFGGGDRGVGGLELVLQERAFLGLRCQALLEIGDGRIALGPTGGDPAVGCEMRVPLGLDRMRTVHGRPAGLSLFVEVLLREAPVGPLRAAFEQAGHRGPQGGSGLGAALVLEAAVGVNGHRAPPAILSTLRAMSSSRSARSRRQAGVAGLLMSWSCVRWWES
jgi:hypothetical protein